DYHNVPFYILLGIAAGLVSLYYTRVYTWTENRIHQVGNGWTRAITGGLLLFVMIVILPPLFGEGYGTIKQLASLAPQTLFHNSILFPIFGGDGEHIVLLALVILAKPMAAAVTIGSGGNGGNFAPALFVGAYLGYVFARVVKLLG